MMRFRDVSWLASERKRLSAWPREALLAFLDWNDPNGTYFDEDLEEPLAHGDALDMVMAVVECAWETPEEIRHAAAAERTSGLGWK